MGNSFKTHRQPLPFLKRKAVTQTLWFTHLPLLDHGAHFVAGEVHSMEVGQTIFALNVFSYQLKFTEGNLIILQISQTHFKYTTLQSIRGNFCIIKKKMQFVLILESYYSNLIPNFHFEE